MEYPAERGVASYRSPGIPRAFFNGVVDHVRQALRQRVSLLIESRV
jgi:hypothetical protein